MVADQGYSKACYRFGLAYESGHGLDSDQLIAMSWLKRSAEQDYAKAQYELARRCVLLNDTDFTTTHGVEWYERAAEQGHLRAQYSLAVCLTRVKGVPKDPEGAFFWMSLAADAGLAKAQYQLGALKKRSVLRTYAAQDCDSPSGAAAPHNISSFAAKTTNKPSFLPLENKLSNLSSRPRPATLKFVDKRPLRS